MDVKNYQEETRFVELDPQRYMQMMYVVLSVQYFGILVMVINCISMLTRLKKYLSLLISRNQTFTELNIFQH